MEQENSNNLYYSQQPLEKPTKAPSAGLAIASMVCGIISLTVSCSTPYLPFVLSLLAVVFGSVSLGKHKGGKEMAIAGLVCGIIGLVSAVIILVVGASLLNYLVNYLGQL